MHNSSGNANRRIPKGELRESHATIQELTSQVQELQERMNCMSDSQDFQDLVDLQWKCISRSQSAGSRSKSSSCVEPRPKPATRYMEFAWDTRKFFWPSTRSNRFITDTSSRNSSLLESKCYKREPRARQYRETCCAN